MQYNIQLFHNKKKNLKIWITYQKVTIEKM